MRVTRRSLVCGLLASAGFSSIVSGQAPRDTLSLAAVVSEARSGNPELRAVRLRADAARTRVSQAGALPDPALTFSLRNRPLDGFGADERMTMNALQLRQTLPWPGKLGFAELRHERLADAADFEALETESALVSRVKAVYFRIAFMDRALEIMRQTQGLLREFLDVSNTLYAVGTGLQADVLQAQVAVASMTEDITVVEQQRIAMAARLNALLGRPPRSPVPWLELPLPEEVLPTVDELMAEAETSRPAVRAAAERVEAAEAAYRGSRRSLYPDFMISAEYAERPQFADMLSFSVGLSIPLWAGSKQLPARQEALALQAMQEAAHRNLLNETYARIAEAHAEADRARRLSRLYATSILPQARAAVESSLSAYRVGEVDFMTLVNNELTVNRYEIETVRLNASYHAAVAELDALVGRRSGEAR